MLREKEIDWAKGIACLCVILLHIYRHIGSMWSSSLFLPTFINKLFFNLIYPLGNTGVPIFFMISGYLLYSKDVSPSFNLVQKRFWAIFLPLAYFGTLYYITDLLRGAPNYHYLEIFINHGYSILGSNLWFLFYIIVPYTLSAFIRITPLKTQGTVFLFLTTVFGLFALSISSTFFPFKLNTSYFSSFILLYLLWGWGLRQLNLRNQTITIQRYFIVFTIIIYILRVLNYRYFKASGTPQELEMFFVSAVLFLFYECINALPFPKKLGNIIDKVICTFAKYSLGVYGWHIIVIFGFKYFIDNGILPISILGFPPFLFIYVSLLALLLAYVDSKFWTWVKSKIKPFLPQFIKALV